MSGNRGQIWLTGCCLPAAKVCAALIFVDAEGVPGVMFAWKTQLSGYVPGVFEVLFIN